MSQQTNPLEKAWFDLIRFGFRLLYNEFAFTYDTVSKVVSLGAWQCWQRSALKHLTIEPGDPVLEIAHGTGDLQLDLNDAGFRVHGHDLSPHMGRIAGDKLRKKRLPARLSRSVAQNLPYASERFAAVVSTFPADFILAPETLRETRRVLRPGGQFIIVPNGVLTGGGVVEESLEWLYRITGQRETDGKQFDIIGYFEPYGFTAEVHQETCPNSVAMVIVATKKD